jgi:hypothetical protein
MSWKVVKYHHPAMYVENSEGKTYHLRVCDNGTILEPASVDDDAKLAAIAHLRGYRRWFGHWLPTDDYTDTF